LAMKRGGKKEKKQAVGGRSGGKKKRNGHLPGQGENPQVRGPFAEKKCSRGVQNTIRLAYTERERREYRRRAASVRGGEHPPRKNKGRGL